YSIDVALTMADAGAAGQTASQVAHVLGAPAAGAAVADAASLRRALARAVGSGSNAPTLDVANALWTQSGLALQPPFVSTLTNDFGAPPESTNFASDPAAALRAINSWVSEHTDALIPALLGPGSITPQTAFVLANAIYLKAHWQNPFAASSTQPAAFTTPDGSVVRVPFMNEHGVTYDYAGGENYQAVELPYSSSSLSLLAILPRGTTLAHFERGLGANVLATIVHHLGPQSVNLSMPKLDLSSQEELNGPLQKLGMTDAFGPAADFRGVTTQRSLYISLVEHAAVLKVDEQGTVAAGASAVISPTTAVPVPREPVSVILNRPYLMLLRDDASGNILFVARVDNPAQG
ncbi:MAG TPA: serpin family protein, partial [Solirubrobacteraceae bacterium]|nr:serpin family protein [Solirubrobacteraceae bacterium]